MDNTYVILEKNPEMDLAIERREEYTLECTGHTLYSQVTEAFLCPMTTNQAVYEVYIPNGLVGSFPRPNMQVLRRIESLFEKVTIKELLDS